MVTIEVAAQSWLKHLETRRRRPAKPATLKTFGAYVRAHITPAIGTMELSEFSNPQMRDFVTLLAAKDLSPKTVHEITGALKAIIASVVDPQTGDPLYVRKWNADFCDLPVVDPGAQHTPVVSKEQIEHALRHSDELYRAFYALLAGSGLRIGEARAIQLRDAGTNTFFDSVNATICVRQSLFQGQPQVPKTAAALRSVEIPMKLSDLLSRFAGTRDGFLFGDGLPLDESTARKRLNKVLSGCGFHSFRRFFVSHRRATGMPEEILRALVGHASSNITDRYSRFGKDAVQRREWVERCGLGFSLPGGK